MVNETREIDRVRFWFHLAGVVVELTSGVFQYRVWCIVWWSEMQ